MPAPDTVTVASPVATLTVELSTTVQALEIPRSVAGQISGLRLKLETGGTAFFQILDRYALAEADTAPTEDFEPLSAGVGEPLEIGIHGAGAGGGPLYVMVWADAGTPNLYIRPVPVGR